MSSSQALLTHRLWQPRALLPPSPPWSISVTSPSPAFTLTPSWSVLHLQLEGLCENQSHILFLLCSFWLPPRKRQILTRSCMTCPLSPGTHPLPDPLAHSAPATPASWLFLQQIRHVPASGPLHWLLPLPTSSPSWFLFVLQASTQRYHPGEVFANLCTFTACSTMF